MNYKDGNVRKAQNINKMKQAKRTQLSKRKTINQKTDQANLHYKTV